MSFCKMIKTCNQKFKILLSYVSLWWLLWCEQTVCELILGVAQGAYPRLPGLSRLSWIDQWMMTWFSRDNLGGSSHFIFGKLSRGARLEHGTSSCHRKKYKYCLPKLFENLNRISSNIWREIASPWNSMMPFFNWLIGFIFVFADKNFVCWKYRWRQVGPNRACFLCLSGSTRRAWLVIHSDSDRFVRASA